MMESYKEFVDYCWSFYNPKDGIYPLEGITKDMILESSWLYLQMCTYPAFPNYQWGDGDSLDREHVRDIAIDRFKLFYS